MVKWFLTIVPNHSMGKEYCLQQWCYYNWISPCKIMKLDPYLTLYSKINSKGIIDQTIRDQALNPLKGNTGRPWWHSGWESACQCRGHGFEPWSGKIPHAAEQLGPWATITEPARLDSVLRNKRGRNNERPAHRDEEWPPLATTG